MIRYTVLRKAWILLVPFVACVVPLLIFRHDGTPSLRSNASDEGADRSSLSRTLYGLRWVAYSPTNFDPTKTPPTIPSEGSLVEDLRTLRRAGFDGLVTYGADLPALPHLAAQAGFRGILLGVWRPDSKAEMALAKQTAQHEQIVAGIICGNEGLMTHRYTRATLLRAMGELRQETGKPVSTTEIIETFMTDRELVSACDFIAPNAHPFFHEVRAPAAASEWTVKAYQNLASRIGNKPLIFKEVGLPTAGAQGLSEAGQAEYYSLLRRSAIHWVYFEGYDMSWKKQPAVEPHWGLFRTDRSPKMSAQDLIALSQR